MITTIVQIILRFWKWLTGKVSKKSKGGTTDTDIMSNHKEKKNKEKEIKVLNFCTRIDGFIRWFVKFLMEATIIAILLNVIANYFWADLPERIPTIYGFFNLLLSFSEFLFKTIFGLIYALFAGKMGNFSETTKEAIQAGMEEIVNFLASIY